MIALRGKDEAFSGDVTAFTSQRLRHPTTAIYCLIKYENVSFMTIVKPTLLVNLIELMGKTIYSVFSPHNFR